MHGGESGDVRADARKQHPATMRVVIIALLLRTSSRRDEEERVFERRETKEHMDMWERE
jgi:hypothetical protein